MNGSLFHVTSTANRDSIREHGLDWIRMGAVRGIAGSPVPEVEGVFVCRDRFEADFFVRINNTGGPVDVWAIEGIDAQQLRTSDTGYAYLPSRIPRQQLTLVERALPEPEPPEPTPGPSAAYSSTLVITLDDGTVLTGDEAFDFFRREVDGPG